MRTYEYDKIRVSDSTDVGLSFRNVNDLKSINERMRESGIIGKDFFKWSGHNAIKFRHFVGLISFDSVSIEILPKIFKPSNVSDQDSEESFTSFVKMLSYVVGFKEQDLEDEYKILRSNKDSLLDILILFFAISLKKAFKKGLYSRYESNNIVSEYLSGKILMEKQLSSIDQTKLFQETYIHTSNTDLMKYLRTASNLFSKVVRSSSIKNELRRLSKYFDEVETVSIAKLKWMDFSFNRLNVQFENAFRQSKLIINGFSFLSSQESKLKGVSILFDMNRVFEDFITELFHRNLSVLFDEEPIPNFLPQTASQWLFPNSRRKKLKPDIQIISSRPDKDLVSIIDAKYKRLDGKNVAEENETDPIMSDLYQMYAYSLKYGAENTVILYPSSETGRKYYDAFAPDRKFMVWGINLNLFERNWEEIIVNELRDLVRALSQESQSEIIS